MAEPSSNDSEAEKFGKLWKLLMTPVGDLSSQDGQNSPFSAGANSGSGTSAQSNTDNNSRYADNNSRNTDSNSRNTNKNSRPPKSAQKPVIEKFASSARKALGDQYGREFTKRHSANQQEKPGKKQHNFRETTKRIGFNHEEGSSPISHSDTRSRNDGKTLYKPGFFTLLFGVFLPIAAMLFETNTHFLAQAAFDPFPTPSHIFLFSLIPISNFLNWLAVRRNIAPLYSVIALSTGMALGIGILYSVMLLSLTANFLAMAIVGVGFLGLAPLLSIPITLMCGNTICQLAERQKTFFDAHQLKHLGHLIILVMVVAVELPSTLTRMHLSMADQGKPEAIQWLRQWGSQDVLLRACYERSGAATDILGTLAEQHHPVKVESARNIFYKVTGVSFNSVPIPASFRGTIKNAGLIDDPAGLNDGVKDEFDLDPDIAGELVSGVARGLSVSNSAITGALDSSSGIASLDWDFTFENVSTIPREARAKILLPPNAVVTKATLWLNDLKRETVIQERSQARETYQQSVVSHKKDPLLVSMAGKDSVLVQCYPVVKGTKTKIRLHIVSPLIVSSKTEESLVMPTFEERNFAITIPHKIDLKSKTKLTLNGTESKDNGASVQLQKDLDNSLLSRFEAVARVGMAQDNSAAPLMMRPPESSSEIHKAFYSLLPESAIAPLVRSTPAKTGKGNHPRLIVVVDKSVTMTPYIADIVNGLKSAPKSLPLTIFEVKDENQLLCNDARSDQDDFHKALKVLSESKCEGGQSDGIVLNNVFSSSQNYDASKPQADVLWIHAAQPVAYSSNDALLNALRSRASSGPALYDLQVASGPNVILPESYSYPKLNRIVRTGSLAGDITTFVENYAKNQIRRPATTFGVHPSGANGNSNKDLAQVQAYKLALARFQAGDSWGAYDLASRYHLVTPVSSAVVTEEAPQVSDKIAEDAIDELKPMEQPMPTAAPVSPQTTRPIGKLQIRGKEIADKSAGFKKTAHFSYANSRNRNYEAQIIDDRPVSDNRDDAGHAPSAVYAPSTAHPPSAGHAPSRQSPASPGRSLEQKQIIQFAPKQDSLQKAKRSSQFEEYAATKEEESSSRYQSPGSFGDAFSSQSSKMAAERGAKNNPSSASQYNESAPSLAGAVNGTIGPQSGDASIMSGANAGMMGGNNTGMLDQKYSFPNFGGSSDNNTGAQSFEGSSNKSSFNPFSSVVTKLNSLSSAGAPSSGAYDPSSVAPGPSSVVPGPSLSGAPVSPLYGQSNPTANDRGHSNWLENLGSAAGERETEFGAYDRRGFPSSADNKVLEAVLLGIGIAFLVMLMIFFRLLPNMTNKPLATKPPDQ
ncbi:MAG: VIT domain-containing protein [Candidatus Melainabacteria bacterium]|nr:VIT domain-containing protein [Candidatus Melainabacteria bacterium]